MILLLDNYDSFTYNLYQLIAKLHPDVKVIRNDALTVDEVKKLAPKAIVISPGPGIPEEAGISVELIQALAPTTPILGICLGHQAMAIAFGGRVVSAPEIVHGKTSLLFHTRKGLFKGLSLPCPVGRYHSLVVERASFPPDLEILAETADETIMAMKHRRYPTYGLQFHPESILTPNGEKMIQAFLELMEPPG